MNFYTKHTIYPKHIYRWLGLTKSFTLQSTANLSIATSHLPGENVKVTAMLILRITCDLPLKPILFDLPWEHLRKLLMGDPVGSRSAHLQSITRSLLLRKFWEFGVDLSETRIVVKALCMFSCHSLRRLYTLNSFQTRQQRPS